MAGAPAGALTLYSDDGETMAYTRGDFFAQPVTLTAQPDGAALSLGARGGTRAAPNSCRAPFSSTPPTCPATTWW